MSAHAIEIIQLELKRGYKLMKKVLKGKYSLDALHVPFDCSSSTFSISIFVFTDFEHAFDPSTFTFEHLRYVFLVENCFRNLLYQLSSPPLINDLAGVTVRSQHRVQNSASTTHFQINLTS